MELIHWITEFFAGFAGGVLALAAVFLALIARAKRIDEEDIRRDERNLIDGFRREDPSTPKSDAEILEEQRRAIGLPAKPKKGWNQWGLTQLFIWIGIGLLVLAVLAIVNHEAWSYGLYAMLAAATYFGYLLTFVEIPPVRFGVILAYNQRMAIVLLEGAHFIWPWQRFRLIEQEVRTLTLRVPVTTYDKVGLEIVGSMQYRPHYMVVDQWGRNRYVELDETTIRQGIEDKIKDELGVIAGVTRYEHFFRARELVRTVIECVLRLDWQKLPHLDSQSSGFDRDIDIDDLEIIDLTKRSKNKMGDVEIEDPDNPGSTKTVKRKIGTEPNYLKKIDGGGDVPRQARFRFYDHNLEKIREAMLEEGQSTIERTYGLDVVLFAIDSIEFSPETKRRLDRVEQAKLGHDEAQHVAEIARLIGGGAEPNEESFALAMALLNRVGHQNTQIILGQKSLSALAGVFGKGGA